MQNLANMGSFIFHKYIQSFMPASETSAYLSIHVLVYKNWQIFMSLQHIVIHMKLHIISYYNRHVKLICVEIGFSCYEKYKKLLILHDISKKRSILKQLLCDII